MIVNHGSITKNRNLTAEIEQILEKQELESSRNRFFVLHLQDQLAAKELFPAPGTGLRSAGEVLQYWASHLVI
jgi:hypothetical protein